MFFDKYIYFLIAFSASNYDQFKMFVKYIFIYTEKQELDWKVIAALG